jgi:hypothetical protein
MSADPQCGQRTRGYQWTRRQLPHLGSWSAPDFAALQYCAPAPRTSGRGRVASSMMLLLVDAQIVKRLRLSF